MLSTAQNSQWLTFTACLYVEYDASRSLGQLGLDDQVRIAARTELVGLFKLINRRPTKHSLALFAAHRHFRCLFQRVI
jgi:hypothetical protein